MRKLWMQCPGCLGVALADDLRPDGWAECECGERMTVIDLRDAGDRWCEDRSDLVAKVKDLEAAINREET